MKQTRAKCVYFLKYLSIKAMLIKVTIVILFIGNIVALAVALGALMKDQGREGGTRTAKFLLLRVSLALALLAVTAFGFYTGQLGLSAPWYKG